MVGINTQVHNFFSVYSQIIGPSISSVVVTPAVVVAASVVVATAVVVAIPVVMAAPVVL